MHENLHIDEPFNFLGAHANCTTNSHGEKLATLDQASDCLRGYAQAGRHIGDGQ